MLDSILRLVNSGLKVFSEERRRHHSKELNKLIRNVQNAENATHPHYSDGKLALAKEELHRYLISYATEFEKGVDELKELASD